MSVRAIPPDEIEKLTVDAYYEPGRKSYWVLNDKHQWISVDKEAVRLRLAEKGLSTRRDGNLICPADKELLLIQNQRSVNFVGAVAGYNRGLYEMSGYRVLVTSGPNPLHPSPGDWSLIRTIIENLLVIPEQITRFYGWLKIADDSLRSGNIIFGQCMVLAGPKGSGKSLLQAIITEILGGRSAKPHRHMMGNTQFNKELFGAEHLMIEDEAASIDTRVRRAFGAAIKLITATREHSCHGKNKDAQMLYPFWRLSISVNDEPENLSILPPIDDSLEDKIIVFRCSKSPMPMPTNTPAESAAFFDAIKGQIAAFVHWLRNDFIIPTDMVAERYGISAYINPALLHIIDGLAPQTRLLTIINQSLLNNGKREITETAEELHRLLLDGKYSHESKQLLNFPTAMGTYLGRLAKSHPKSVIKDKRKNDQQYWTVQREADDTLDTPAPPFIDPDSVKIV